MRKSKKIIGVSVGIIVSSIVGGILAIALSGHERVTLEKILTEKAIRQEYKAEQVEAIQEFKNKLAAMPREERLKYLSQYEDEYEDEYDDSVERYLRYRQLMHYYSGKASPVLW